MFYVGPLARPSISCCSVHAAPIDRCRATTPARVNFDVGRFVALAAAARFILQGVPTTTGESGKKRSKCRSDDSECID